MTALQGSPRFTGFIRRLVEEGVISAEDMRSALAHAKQEKIDIVAELINQQQLSPTVIAETISVEFGEPLFDISAYDPAQILRDAIDEKLITKHRILPIFKNSSIYMLRPVTRPISKQLMQSAFPLNSILKPLLLNTINLKN